MPVVVVLVDRHHARARIDERAAEPTRAISEAVVTMPTAQGELWDFTEHAAGINEEVYPAEVMQCAILSRVRAKGFRPVGAGEVDRHVDVVVRAPPTHHEPRKIDLRHGF